MAQARDSVVSLALRVERKLPSLPRYVVVPAAAIATWGLTATTLLDVTLDGRAVGQRTIKRWDGARWFVTITQPDCDRGGFDTGDSVRLTLSRAGDSLPAELAELIARDASARKAWRALTASQQRMLREHVAQARRTDTRAARAQSRLIQSRI